MSRYDTRTTTFSQEGRIFQVEYALEAINNASSTIGIVTKNGVVIAADQMVSSKLLDPGTSKEKIYIVDEHIICAIAGWTADANVLLHSARLAAQRHFYKYDEAMHLETLVTHLCDIKQSYTQFGGLRPFGVSFLFAGHDSEKGFQLVLTDPAGNFSMWRATAVGQNSVTALSILKQEWNEELSLQDGLALAAKVLTQITDAGSQTIEETEFAVVYQDELTHEIRHRFLTQQESLDLLKNASKSSG